MSIWNDIRKRGIGQEIKKEDQANENFRDYENLWESSEPVAQPLVFSGIIDKNNIPTLPTSGEIYCVQDDISINGQAYHPGTWILFDGKSWHNLSDFVHKKIDTGIGYYQPVYTADSRF